MTYKTQTECYRTFDGVRWVNLCDVLSAQDERLVAEYIAAGKRIKFRKHAHGFRQAFIHPDDLAAALHPTQQPPHAGE
jgi:hypothetical protein